MSIEELSSQELQVWKYVVQGLSLKQMSEKMGIGTAAVSVKLMRLCQKLGISDRPGTPRYSLLIELAQQWMSK